jgi:DNA-binding NtrC family response regulator
MEKSNGKRILLIDDDMDYVKSFSHILQNRGYDVVSVQSGFQAISHLETEVFDLAVADMRMPHMNGLTLLDHIKRRWPSICVIVVTGSSADKLSKKSLQKGAFDCINKDSIQAILSGIERGLKEAKRNETRSNH